MTTRLAPLAASVLLTAFGAAAPAQAELLSFEGSIATNRDVIRIAVTLAAPLTNVVIWTDSHQGGANFDPITALWRDGRQLGQNDDRGWLMPGQTVFDSGLTFGSLEAGEYLLTITSFANFSTSTVLADGFWWDDPAAVETRSYCDAAGACTRNNWRVHLQDGFASPVPEPAQYALLAAGALLLGARRRWRS